MCPAAPRRVNGDPILLRSELLNRVSHEFLPLFSLVNFFRRAVLPDRGYDDSVLGPLITAREIVATECCSRRAVGGDAKSPARVSRLRFAWNHGVRGSATMGLRDAHFFRKVPNDVTEATKVGGLILSLIHI